MICKHILFITFVNEPDFIFFCTLLNDINLYDLSNMNDFIHN